ncbi:MAG: nucleotidyltransferase family protein [Candidatus Acidiferrales bacterium]
MPKTFVQPLTPKMPPEADLLFSTARVRMTTEIADRIRAVVRGEVNWIHLVQLALQHETTALLYWNLQRICSDSVPAGILEPLAARYKVQVAEARHRAEELVRILGALEDQGIFALGYKGPILAQRLYGDLSLREFSKSSDLDIIIHECDLPKAQAVILDQGYEKQARSERELIFREHSGERFLELHWHFTTHLSRVPDDPKRFLQRFEMVPLAGATVRSLPLEEYFLVLSLHATKHKWRKLKLICDIAEILGSRDVDWEYVAREAEDLGLKRILALGVLLAEDPLRVVAPAELTRRLKIDRAARVLAAECRQELLKEPDDLWRFHADFRFMLKIRERPHDRISMFLWEWLWPKTMPDEDDRRFARIPQSLWAMYYFVRPVRLAWREITERP